MRRIFLVNQFHPQVYGYSNNPIPEFKKCIFLTKTEQVQLESRGMPRHSCCKNVKTGTARPSVVCRKHSLSAINGLISKENFTPLLPCPTLMTYAPLHTSLVNACVTGTLLCRLCCLEL